MITTFQFYVVHMKEFPEYSTYRFEGHRNDTYPWFSSIYILSCCSIVACLALSAFLKVDINVSSPGAIRPVAEISMVRSMVGGRIKELLVHENKTITKGDVLYSLEPESYELKEKYLRSKRDELKSFIRDLNILIAPAIRAERLATPLYRQAAVTYQQQLYEAVSRYEKATLEFDRSKVLHSQSVIADADFEDFGFKLNQAELALTVMKQTQMSQWQSQLSSYTADLNRIESEAEQLKEDKRNLVIRSPISGTVQNLAGIYPGSLVYPNQELALISPDTSLIVEVFVSPHDVGLLKPGLPVKFQADAFSYSQWGLGSGKILEISNDVHVIDGKPVFKAQCSLSKNYLELKNGYKGYLRKGMTMRARFIVARRTLYQLLYDKIDDWLDPNTVNQTIAAER